jgi:hypothetical protein
MAWVSKLVPLTMAAYLFYLALTKAELRPGLPGIPSDRKPAPKWFAFSWYIGLGIFSVFLAIKYW